MKQKKLWKLSKDSMRRTIQDRATLCGYPKNLFSFHSLRAGFLCLALIKAGTNKQTVQAVLENTAFIAGWVPNQSAQLSYVKECAKKLLYHQD
jgi:hypothetical protein